MEGFKLIQIKVKYNGQYGKINGKEKSQNI
jgi:hypothetical protein